MTYHCPRCSEFVAQDAKGCTACGADFVALGWEVKHSPVDLEAPDEAPGKTEGSFLLLLFTMPAALVFIGVLFIGSLFFGSGAGILLAIVIGLIGVPFLVIRLFKAGIKIFKS